MMQPVSVAIADVDYGRRATYEHSLRDEPGVRLLANVASDTGTPTSRYPDRRARSRENVTVIEDELARVKRLMPRVLLMDMSLCADESCIMLKSLRRECPETLVVLVGDESGDEDLILKALETGARGYLSHEAAHHHLPRVAPVIDRGEVWVSRKMLGKVMDRIQHRE